MRVALDTNVLAYAEGIGDSGCCASAIELVERLPAESVLIPAQTLGELYRVITGKAGRDAGLAREALMTWADSFEDESPSLSRYAGTPFARLRRQGSEERHNKIRRSDLGPQTSVFLS